MSRDGCEVCGAWPVLSETGMCGPCTFGTADALGEGDVFGPGDSMPRARRATKGRTQPVPAGMLGCTVCDRNFNTQDALDAHRGSVHRDVRAYKCPVRGCRMARRGFVTQRGLADHKRDKHRVAAEATR